MKRTTTFDIKQVLFISICVISYHVIFKSKNPCIILNQWKVIDRLIHPLPVLSPCRLNRLTYMTHTNGYVHVQYHGTQFLSFTDIYMVCVMSIMLFLLQTFVCTYLVMNNSAGHVLISFSLNSFSFLIVDFKEMGKGKQEKMYNRRNLSILKMVMSIIST